MRTTRRTHPSRRPPFRGFRWSVARTRGAAGHIQAGDRPFAARRLNDGVLLWQVACEFLNASRKLAALGFDYDQAWQELRQLRLAWTSILPSWPVLNRADRLRTRYSLSVWDSLIIAACLEGGVELLYSEDFDSYPLVDTLKIVNPFKTS